MSASASISEFLFMEWARGKNSSLDRAQLRAELEYSASDESWQPMVQLLESIDDRLEPLAVILKKIEKLPIDADTQQFALLRSAYAQGMIEDIHSLRLLEQYLTQCATPFPLIETYIKVLHGYFFYARGETSMAQEQLSTQVSLLQSAPPSPLVDFILCTADSFLGHCMQSQGNFIAAEKSFEASYQLADKRGYFYRWKGLAALAELNWASGQFRTALKMHTNSEARMAARESGNMLSLTRSHLMAAKCAIDLKSIFKAQDELASAQRILGAHPELHGSLQGFLQCFRGELELLRDNRDEALSLLRDAQVHFEQLDPPYYPGALQTKIALCHFAMHEKDYGQALSILQILLDEATATGCLDARARLLVLESSLFLKSQPPLLSAYEDLVTRLHLINNPTLLFQALGNLAAYAAEYLEESHLEAIVNRMQDVQPLLADSCSKSLFEGYLTSLYNAPLNPRIAQLLPTAKLS